MVFLMETKLYGIEVVVEGARGGLCLAWKKDIIVGLCNFFEESH